MVFDCSDTSGLEAHRPLEAYATLARRVVAVGSWTATGDFETLLHTPED